jgi:RHS repeat-associated protein
MMAGISSKALLFGNPKNKYKYNGIELENDFELNTYDAYYRELDPQTGRWWQVDPKIENMEAWSPYTSNFDNPITFSDPLGDEPDEDDPPKKGFWNIVGDAAMTGVNWINENINPLTPIAEAISGKAFNWGKFDVEKSRLNSIAEAGISLIPGGKIEGGVIKQLDKVIVKEGAEVAEKQVLKSYEKTLSSSAEASSKKINGNSKSSTKPTTLYRLETSDGKYLKTGVTSQKNPEKRYTNAFMADKKMIRLDNGTRAEMLKKERKIVERNPGPMNREKWAGKNKKDD